MLHLLFLSGMVKKAVGVLGIIHDLSKVNENEKECRSAISHTKESKASINAATYNLNPVKVLYLFKRMTDEVHVNILIKSCLFLKYLSYPD